MTLVVENRKLELLKACISQGYPAIRKSGGSACNTVVAASCFGASTFFCGKVATDDDGEHFIHDLLASGVTFKAMGAERGITREVPCYGYSRCRENYEYLSWRI